VLIHVYQRADYLGPTECRREGRQPGLRRGHAARRPLPL
jgi:hypothetical protein